MIKYEFFITIKNTSLSPFCPSTPLAKVFLFGGSWYWLTPLMVWVAGWAFGFQAACFGVAHAVLLCIAAPNPLQQ
jgi:hypothetical protein